MNQKPSTEIDREIARRTRRSFLVGGLGAAAGLAGLWGISRAGLADGIPWPLRRVLDGNARLAQTAFRAGSRAPEFPRAVAQMPRANGHHGLATPVDPKNYRLAVRNPAVAGKSIPVPLDFVYDLPRVEMVTELKCIEGWSTVVHWAGARFADFAAAQRRDSSSSFVGLSTPDGNYYVGLDLASATHPQTLLGYEMNGEPLADAHGAPLRLITPVKYGIKNIKRIGAIEFVRERPRDFWAERGYDWYAGL